MTPLLSSTGPKQANARWHGTLPRFVLGAALALAFPSDLGAQTVLNLASAKVKSCAGTVNIVQKSGAITPAYVGVIMQPGEKLQVGANGTTELDLPGAGAARVDANSEVKLPDVNGNTPPQESLEMLKGRLFLNIDAKELKKQGKREFRLKTPATVLAVKGTRFFAFAAATGDTLGVHEGMVEAYEPVSKQSRRLEAGTAVEASPGKLSAPRAQRPAEQACDFIYPGAPAPGWVVPIGDGHRCLTIGFIQTGNGDRYYLRNSQDGDDLWKESRNRKREVVFQFSNITPPYNLSQIVAGPDDTIFVTMIRRGSKDAGLYKLVGGKLRLVAKQSAWTSQLDPKEEERAMVVSFGRNIDGTIDPQDLYFHSFQGVYRTKLISRNAAGPPVLTYPEHLLGFTMVGANDVYVGKDGPKPEAVIQHLKHPPDRQAPTTIARLPLFPSGIHEITMGVWPLDDKPKPKP